MKKYLAILIVIILCGCNEAPSNEAEPKTLSDMYAYSSVKDYANLGIRHNNDLDLILKKADIKLGKLLRKKGSYTKEEFIQVTKESVLEYVDNAGLNEGMTELAKEEAINVFNSALEGELTKPTLRKDEVDVDVYNGYVDMLTEEIYGEYTPEEFNTKIESIEQSIYSYANNGQNIEQATAFLLLEETAVAKKSYEYWNSLTSENKEIMLNISQIRLKGEKYTLGDLVGDDVYGAAMGAVSGIKFLAAGPQAYGGWIAISGVTASVGGFCRALIKFWVDD